MDFYGTTTDYIHLKWGDMQKAYNFTDGFRAKYPNFCAEYELYWNGDKKCRFKHPLEIAQYIDRYSVPVHLYFNFTDEPVNDITEVYEYLIRECAGISREYDGSIRENYNNGLDGEEPRSDVYKVVRV